MLKRLLLNEFTELAKAKPRVAVYQEFSCDDLTPYVCFHLLKGEGKGAVLLESAITDGEFGRYSLIALEPSLQFSANYRDPSFSLESLRSTLQDKRCAPDANLPPLVGGAVGVVSYDAVRFFEAIPDRHSPTDLSDLLFLFHDLHIAFDHFNKRMTVCVLVDVGSDVEGDYNRGVQKIQEVRGSLSQPAKFPKALPFTSSCAIDEISDEAFCQKVERAKQYLREGDAFQIVLSRSFKKAFKGSTFDVYRALRLTNPSPFMFYVETEQFTLAGSSPERLVKAERGLIKTMPIAGTRPRVAGKEKEIEQELLNDPKEAAEHMMLVDLGRNDLGAVAEIGSVHVKELKKVRHFAHVSHLVSVVEAVMKPQYDALDAIKAVFPAGTLSGAPKIRAMEIIDELEESRRGFYGGSICTIDNAGDLESCIAIRLAHFQNGEVSVRAGAGVVLDSDPEKEAAETRHKAKGVLEAIRLVEEGTL